MKSIKTLLPLLFCAALGLSLPAFASPPSSAESQRIAARCAVWQDDIKRAVRKYWAAFPFALAWTGQVWQESLCDADARSPVGAAGPAQFMPATWREVAAQLRLPAGSTPHDRIAIEAGAFYMARQMGVWSSPRPAHERWRLGLASYNAGAGNIIRAQRACGGARDWRAIELCLPMVTGENAAETRVYVPRTERWWRALGGCAPLSAPREIQEEWGC